MHAERKAPDLPVTKQYFLRWKEKKWERLKSDKIHFQTFFLKFPFVDGYKRFKQKQPLMSVCKQTRSKDQPFKKKKTLNFLDTVILLFLVTIPKN